MTLHTAISLMKYEQRKRRLVYRVRRYQAYSHFTNFPTIRALARSLKLTQAAVLQLAEDAEEISVNIDIGIAYRSGGHAVHPQIGDYTLEAEEEIT